MNLRSMGIRWQQLLCMYVQSSFFITSHHSIFSLSPWLQGGPLRRVCSTQQLENPNPLKNPNKAGNTIEWNGRERTERVINENKKEISIHSHSLILPDLEVFIVECLKFNSTRRKNCTNWDKYIQHRTERIELNIVGQTHLEKTLTAPLPSCLLSVLILNLCSPCTCACACWSVHGGGEEVCEIAGVALWKEGEQDIRRAFYTVLTLRLISGEVERKIGRIIGWKE